MNQPSSPFRHQTKIQIRFKDVDAMGHVNNANHLTYFELARVQYFNDVIREKINWSAQGIILARMEINYILPILMNDDVRVLCRVSRIGSKSFDMEYQIVKYTDGHNILLAEGKSVQVCFDYTVNATMKVPASWIEKVTQFEDPVYFAM